MFVYIRSRHVTGLRPENCLFEPEFPEANTISAMRSSYDELQSQRNSVGEGLEKFHAFPPSASLSTTTTDSVRKARASLVFNYEFSTSFTPSGSVLAPEAHLSL